MWALRMGRDNLVDEERLGKEATKGKSKGENSGQSSRNAKDSGDQDFPTCHVCDKVFNKGNSWVQNEHGRMNHMKTHEVDKEREQKSPSEVTQSWRPWSPFRGKFAME